MKRPATSDASDSSERPSKQPRCTESDDPFSASLKKKASSLQASFNDSKDGFIAGKVKMNWSQTSKGKRLQLLTEDDDIIEVEFRNHPKKVNVEVNDHILLSLQGAILERKQKPPNSSKSLPFGLAFTGDWRLKIVRSDKNVVPKGLLIDTFEERQVEKRNQEDNWFSTPLIVPMPPSPASLHHDMPNHDSPIEAAPMPSESISLSDGGRHESLPAVKTAKEKHQRPSAASPIDAAKPPTPISLKMSKERLIREANDQTNSKSRRSKATKTLKKMEGHVPNRKIEQIPSPVPPKVVQSPSKAAFKPGLPSSHGDWLSLEKVISSIQGKKVSTIGIAVAVSGQKLTARGDWSCSFKLLDSSNMDRPFMVNMFSKEPFTALPYEGCPLLLHELVIRRFGKTADDEEKPAGVGYADSLKWASYNPVTQRTVFRHENQIAGMIREKEKQYVNDLNDWWRGLQAEMPNNPQTTTTFKAARAPKRELLIKDAKIREFFIAHVEVLHIWTESDTNFHPHVYVTDYTPLPEFAHSSHVYNPDLSRFDGILLRISLYDGDKEAASVLKIGGFYTFGNLHFVDGRRGTYAKQGQGASKIFRLTDPEKIRQLSLRKKKFFEQRSSASITANKEETAAHLSQNLPPDIIATTLTRHSRPIIRCEYEDQPISNIASILANNNFPNKYRLQAKLVSIRPSKVEEAIVGYCTLHKRRLKVQERRCHECGMDDDPQYSFLLMICVQDQAGDTLDVVISGEEAKALIGVEPMLILDDESDALSQLRSRLAPLFRLIGESGKAAGRTTAPLLDLAVQSWKANVNGAEFPVYRLFGCTLQSE